MRLLRLAVILLISTFGYGQHAGMHGGSGGFFRSGLASGGSRGGFTLSPFRSNSVLPGFRGGAPMLHNGIAPRSGLRPAPPGFMGPVRFAPRMSPSPARGSRPFGGAGMNMASSYMHRVPFHSPHGHRGHDGHFHNHVFIVNPFFPFTAFPSFWGYSFGQSIFDDGDNWANFDSQPTENYEAPQPSYNGNGYQYQPQPDDQDSPEQQPQPSGRAHRAPDEGADAPFQPSGAIVYKNGPILEYKWVTPNTAHGPR